MCAWVHELMHPDVCIFQEFKCVTWFLHHDEYWCDVGINFLFRILNNSHTLQTTLSTTYILCDITLHDINFTMGHKIQKIISVAVATMCCISRSTSLVKLQLGVVAQAPAAKLRIINPRRMRERGLQ